MAAIQDWHVVFLGHLVDGGEEAHEVLLGVDVFFTVGTQKDVFAFLQAKTLVDVRSLNLFQIVVQHLGHRATRNVSALLRQTRISQVTTSVL